MPPSGSIMKFVNESGLNDQIRKVLELETILINNKGVICQLIWHKITS